MKRWPLIVGLLLTLVYTSYFTWFTFGRHAKTNSTRFDLGNVEQIVWNGAQGRWFQSTDPYGTATVSRLVYHADYFLMALVPFYAVIPATETLLLLQTLALASGIPAVWLIARRMLKDDRVAVIVAGVYALQPSLHWMNIFDVHAVAFATPLILWTWWAALTKRYWLMFGLAVLAMLTKEQIGLGFAVLAVWLWWRQRQMRWSLVMLVPVAWSVLALLVFIPNAQSETPVSATTYHSRLGQSAADVLRNGLQHPDQLWETVVSRNNVRYVVELLSPYGFLPIGHWLSLGALPDLSINFVSGKIAQQSIWFHYGAGIIPWAMIGMISALAWIRGRRHPWLKHGVLVWLGIWAITAVYITGPLPGAKYDFTRVVTWRNAYARKVQAWSNRIPTAAAVSVTNNVGSHFSRRQHFYSFPFGTELADYVVVLEGHAGLEVASPKAGTQQLSSLVADPAWEILEHYQDFWVLKRIP